MRSVLALLALSFLAVAPVAAQDPPKEGEKKEEPKAAIDADALWKHKGRSWTIKYVTKMSGVETVTFNKYQVTEVSEVGAKYKLTLLDKDKKETYSSELAITFEAAKGPVGGAEDKGPETTEEKIKVEAGEFECLKWTTESSGNETTVWVSKKYGGLTVKSEVRSDTYKSSAELVEFKD